jgi:hypothetical protein
VKSEAPRRRIVRSSLLATAATGFAIMGSAVAGVAGMDGNLERAAAQQEARQAEQLWQHRQVEVGAPRDDARVRYRDVRDRRERDCPWSPRERDL